jgi:hypothetical protein
VNNKHLILAVTTTLIVWPAFAQAQAGKPVTAADLSGKTVCWDDGWRITYAADGGYLSARGDAPVVRGHTRWSISSLGTLKLDRGEKQQYLQLVVLPDGRLERDWFVGKPHHHTGVPGMQQTWGTICH